jgi:hypothetical protein
VNLSRAGHRTRRSAISLMKSEETSAPISQLIVTEDRLENDLRVKPGKGVKMTTRSINSLRLWRDPNELNTSSTKGETG